MSPKALFREWLSFLAWALFFATHGSGYDRQIARAFVLTGEFPKWMYELYTTWPDNDLRFLAVLDNQQDLIDALEIYTTKADTLPPKRLRHLMGTQCKMTGFREARAKVGKLPVYVFPDFPLPDPSAVLAEAIQNWKDCQGPARGEPEPTLDDVISYMEAKFDKVFQGGPDHRQ